MMLLAPQRAAARPVNSCNRRAFAPDRSCVRLPRTKELQAAPQAASISTVPQPPAELLQEVEQLLALRTTEGTSQEQVAEQLSKVEKLSADAGTNKLFMSINNGSFKGRTVAGRLAELGSRELSLGEISFNQYKPATIMVKPLTTSFVNIIKGPAFGYENGYVAQARFRLVDAGVEGMSSAIATFEQDSENDQRLHIQFQAMRLEPVLQQDGDLDKWLKELQPHNPDMGDDGVLQVALPPHKGTLDHLVMTEQYQLVRGNLGSTTLLERI